MTAEPGTEGLLVLRGRVVCPAGVLEDGVVVCQGDRITWVGAVSDLPPDTTVLPSAAAIPPRGTRTLLPGLVDVHCHGGAGGSFPDGDLDGARRAAAHHRRHGTTTLLASLVSAPASHLDRLVPPLAALVEEGVLAGVHLEGPFLSPARAGAQDPAALVPGDPAALARWLELGRGTVRSMTLAPETAHAGDLAVLLLEAGAVPSIGHTDADAATTSAFIAAVTARGGPVSATHLFNGMPPLHHRSPGPVAACLAGAARGEVVVELVGDGVHLDDAAVGAVLDLVGPGQVAFVTDAMAAAGMPDGRYPLGALEVEVAGGVARLAGGGRGGRGDRGDRGDRRSIAGGTSCLVDVVRRAAGHHGLHAAVTAASSTPAALLGMGHLVGSLLPGLRADVLVTDDDLVPMAVLAGGRWVAHPTSNTDRSTDRQTAADRAQIPE